MCGGVGGGGGGGGAEEHFVATSCMTHHFAFLYFNKLE